MRTVSFIKRLNATELGLGATNDTYIAIPREYNLSSMFLNKEPITVIDRISGELLAPPKYNIMYVQTGQNNQERISGLGTYYASNNLKVGDEVVLEKETNGENSVFYISCNQRNVIVFQKNSQYVEILSNDIIQKYAVGEDFLLNVVFENQKKQLTVKYINEAKKKKTSPEMTKFFDLIVDGKSILNDYAYQEYIEILLDDMRLEKMKTCVYSEIEVED